MNNTLAYSGINTKVRAMGANLIDTEGYKRIAAIETITDFIIFLKRHPGYRELFNWYDERQLHRGEAERIFINVLYLDYAKIYRFANKSQRRSLELLFFRYEVNILKSCIRLVFSEENDFSLSQFDPFFRKHSRINVPALAVSKSMDEFIRNLKDTEYYNLFSGVQNDTKLTAFDYEMQLDIYYFKKSWKLKDKSLSHNDQRIFTRILGTEIDLLNIMWIYRARKIYHMSPNDIFTYVIPVDYKLSKEQLVKLADANTQEEFMALLEQTYYKKIHGAFLNGTMEDTYRSIITDIYKDNMMKYAASMAAANYYLYRKQDEISRLTTALECIRYGLDPQDKLKYILQ